jgi:hypothetical protein
MRLALSLLTAAAALVAVPAAHAQTINCGRVNSTHGRGAAFIHYDATLELEASDTTTCDEASQVVSAWFETGDPNQGKWLCQSSHGGGTDVIGTCAQPEAAVTATGVLETAVERRCANVHGDGIQPTKVRAFSTPCRAARRVAKRATRVPTLGGCAVVKGQRLGMKKGCKVSGYRCKDRKVNARTSRIRCLRGQRREIDFRLA